MSEFDAHAECDSSDAYDHFDGWEEAVDAADIDFASRQKLLSELHRLESQLGFVPLASHVDDHSRFSAYDYRLEFGSVDAALEKAGLDSEVHVMETLREVVANTDGKPRMVDFADASPYSQGIIYKYFDSWDDAIAAARSEMESGRTSEGAGDEPEGTTVDQEPERNELSERYELLRNLRALVTAVVDACEADREQDDPMVEWASTVEEFWNDGPAGAESYGAQQNERNPFSIREYRRTFGNGTRVTEFEHVTSVPPCPSVGGVLAPLLDDDPSTYYLPVDPDTGASLPVVVESQDELRRARGMLQRLPPEPEAVTRTGQPDMDETDASEESGDPSTSERPSDDLLDVSGVTESIAQSLSETGYTTREDLRRASMEELTSVDGINEQVVMRIKLDVGE
jgi:transcription termination factor NusA